jgi:hypothetical protein
MSANVSQSRESLELSTNLDTLCQDWQIFSEVTKIRRDCQIWPGLFRLADICGNCQDWQTLTDIDRDSQIQTSAPMSSFLSVSLNPIRMGRFSKLNDDRDFPKSEWDSQFSQYSDPPITASEQSQTHSNDETYIVHNYNDIFVVSNEFRLRMHPGLSYPMSRWRSLAKSAITIEFETKIITSIT